MPGPYYYKSFKEVRETTVFGIATDNTDPEYVLTPGSKSAVIDIVSDFSWTASPIKDTNANKVTKVYLTERKLDINSTLASAQYYLYAAKESFVGDAVSNLLGTVSTTTSKWFDNLFGNLSEDASLLTQAGPLKSYIGIYQTSQTGFNYVLPYFNDNILGANNRFDNSPQNSNMLTKAVEAGSAIADEVLYAVNITQPGSFIEKSRHFQFPQEGASVTVTFPLLNTIAHNDKIPYQQNYEFLYGLVFQNKSYRTSFSRILPPKIYTLTIPGQQFFPYCYISDLKINFNGIRRVLDVTVPGIVGNRVIQAPIPEAYIVSITFQSLLADVGNMMLSQGFNRKIIVETAPETPSPQFPVPQDPKKTAIPTNPRNTNDQQVPNSSGLQSFGASPNPLDFEAPGVLPDKPDPNQPVPNFNFNNTPA